MEKSKALQMIAEISNARGASGFEEEPSEVIRRWGEGLGTFAQDKMNNLYLYRKENRDLKADSVLPLENCEKSPSRRLRVQLDAHMDEVGFMVRHILPNGCLAITPIGGWVASNIPAHKVLVRKPDGTYITGITGSKPPHFMSAEEREKGLTIDHIIVDIGTSSMDETLALGIEIGEPIVPDVQCTYDEERDLLIGKAFDCRSGCAAILDTLRGLEGRELEVDICAAFSTQEEVGTRGAGVTAQRVQPDIAIVFEGCPADDTFGESYASQTKIHHGPMLRHIDARMISHPRFQRFALELGKELGIPVQRAVRTGGSTNGAPIHVTGKAVPAIVIGVPVRYIHTHYGITTYFDHEAAVKLATEILLRLNDEVYDKL